jgi:transcriptional regulator NrdR family protein
MEEITDEFRSKMSEWVNLKKELTEARKDMKVLNTRERELKLYIKSYMKSQKIDNVNLKQGKVTYKKSQKKPAFSKKAVVNGLLNYFDNDEEKVEEIINAITDTLEVTESDNISLTGLKTKNE